ncbi:MAG: sodium:proton exchanger [Planctomycetes bacterium]|nr:sodium:proton exchanger [Planctomycetota bacterium]
MHEAFWHPVTEVLILLAAALVSGLIFERLRQSAMLGYLLAGTLLGPGALDWIHERDVVSAMAELGVALLLFTIGLEFSVRRLIRIGPIGLGGGTAQVVLTLLVTAAACWIAGTTPSAAVAIGAMIALSSTACVLRVLSDRAEIDSVFGRGALGILLFQDIALVPLVLIVTQLGSGGSSAEIAAAVGRTVLMIVAMVGAFYLLSTYVLAPMLRTSTMLRNHELLVLLAAVLALGAAWAATKLELSPAMGAFVAGIMLAESPFAVQVRSDIGALRTLFVTLFFASIGMLADLGWLMEHWMSVAGVVALIIVGKTLVTAAVVRALRYRGRDAVATGVCLAQVGEFSFVLAGVARDGKVIDDAMFRLFVSATLVTLFATPYLVALAPHAAAWVARFSRRAVDDTAAASDAAPAHHDHVVIIGFGPAGQRVGELMRFREIPAVVIDIAPRNVTLARTMGIGGQVGDGSSPEVLHHVHAADARLIVITLPDRRSTLETVHKIRALAPNVPIIARARYHAFVRDIELAGAQVVIDEEQQIGRRLSVEVRRLLALAPGQVAPPRTGNEQALWRTSES